MLSDIFPIIMGMVRPPKDKRDRKEAELRIPVTVDQKELIAQAASAGGVDMAAWARPILIHAAQSMLGKIDANKEKKDEG
jgi:hypothetical protein